MLRTADKRLFVGSTLSTVFGPGPLQRGPDSRVPPVAGYEAWYDASDERSLTYSGGTVTEWADKGPNGFDLTAGGVGKLRRLATRNGRGVIWFDSAAYLSNGSVSLADRTFSVFYAAMLHEFFLDNTVVGPSANGGLQFVVNSDTRLRVAKAGTAYLAAQSNAAVTAGVPFVGGAVVTATDITQYTNLVSETDADSTSVSAASLLVGTSVGQTSSMEGWIGELLIYDTSLSSGDALATVGHLMSKWGIS